MEDESRTPEWDKLGPGETAKAMRPLINGQVKYQRIPIRRRQLKCEIANFIKWIDRLKNFEVELIAKQEAEGKPYTPFFVGQTSMLIIARDRDEIVQAEFGSHEEISKIIVLIQDPLTREDEWDADPIIQPKHNEVERSGEVSGN